MSVPAALGMPLRLSVGVEAGFADGRTLALVEVTGDSRCPMDVQCIWAGGARLAFAWASPGTPDEVRRVPVVASPSRGSAALAGGLRLRLLSLLPAPISTAKIAPSAYVATVVVELTATPTAGVFGTLTVGPMCLVQRVDDPCPDRPLAGTLAIRDRAGVEVARATSDGAGFYALALPTGCYAVVPLTPGGAALPRGAPRDIDVAVGDWTAADISYDSGIR